MHHRNPVLRSQPNILMHDPEDSHGQSNQRSRFQVFEYGNEAKQHASCRLLGALRPAFGTTEDFLRLSACAPDNACGSSRWSNGWTVAPIRFFKRPQKRGGVFWG